MYDVSIEPGRRVISNLASNVCRNRNKIHIVPGILFNVNYLKDTHKIREHQLMAHFGKYHLDPARPLVCILVSPGKRFFCLSGLII